MECPKCGAPGSIEFKRDTFVCQYCENVFKRVDSRVNMGAASCEVLANGRACGVPAIGRCSTDGRAFCMTHQGRSGAAKFPDQCSDCRYAADQAAILQQETARLQQEANERRFGRTYLADFARQELRGAKLPTVNLIETRTERREVRGKFKGYEQRTYDIGTGWLLGECIWAAKYWNGKQLTVLVDRWEGRDFPDIDTEYSTNNYGYGRNRLLQEAFGLCLVENKKRGYEVSFSTGVNPALPSVLDAARVIHTLVGT